MGEGPGMIDIGPSEGTLSPQDAGASLPLCLPWSSWGAQEDTLGWLRPNLPTYLGFVLSCFVFFRKYLITLIGPLLSQALIPAHTHTMNEMGVTLQWTESRLQRSRGRRGGQEGSRALKYPRSVISPAFSKAPRQGHSPESRFRIPPLLLCY